MRQARLVVLAAAAWAACGGALAAQERGGLLVGVDTGLLLDSPRTGDNEFHFLPPFASYFLTERLRLDLAPRLGLGWSGEDHAFYDIGVGTGLRYYYLLGGERKFRLNGGFALGFDLIERRATSADPGFSRRAEDLFDYRLVPLELEYWRGRSAFSLGLEYGGTVYDGAEDDVGPGITIGYRWRIK